MQEAGEPNAAQYNQTAIRAFSDPFPMARIDARFSPVKPPSDSLQCRIIKLIKPEILPHCNITEACQRSHICEP